jgi:CheY-like chemotaxis protein
MSVRGVTEPLQAAVEAIPLAGGIGRSIPTAAEATMPAIRPSREIHRIAVCDDDLAFIRFVERLFSCAGATIVPVTTLDPAEAVRVIGDAGCDAALIDLRMYNDDHAGLTLVRLLRECPTTMDIPLEMVSGATRELKKHADYLHELRCAVLPKPVSAEDLLASLGLAWSGAAA